MIAKMLRTKSQNHILITIPISNYFSQKDTYLTMLNSYNMDLRKVPSNNQTKAEKALFDKITQQIQNKTYAQFLFDIRRMRLFDSQNLDYIESWALSNISSLCENPNIIKIQAFFAEQRRHKFVQEIQKQKQWQGFQKFLQMYFRSIVEEKIIKQDNQNGQTDTFGRKVQRQWGQQLKFIRLFNQKETTIEQCKMKKRSPLQIEVESLLHTLDCKFIRQSIINDINVDFLIQNQFILQILGPYHFTVDGHQKGRDIVRKLVLQQWYPVKFLTHDTLNTTIGIQNKLTLLQSIIKGSKLKQ